MNMQQTCDPDRLDAFVRGELSEQQESELTAHLDQCETCGEELERRVAASDQWREAGELLTHRARRSNVVDLANDPSTNASSATSTTFAEQMDQVIGMLAPTESLLANRLKAKQQRIPPRRCIVCLLWTNTIWTLDPSTVNGHCCRQPCNVAVSKQLLCCCNMEPIRTSPAREHRFRWSLPNARAEKYWSRWCRSISNPMLPTRKRT